MRETEIMRRLTENRTWKNRIGRIKCKQQMYKEKWTSLDNTTRITQQHMEQDILGYTLRDKNTLIWIMKQMKMVDVAEMINKAKWRWVAHIARMPKERWAKIATVWKPWSRKRNVGRPIMRRYYGIQRILGRRWTTYEQDREKSKMKGRLVSDNECQERYTMYLFLKQTLHSSIFE